VHLNDLYRSTTAPATPAHGGQNCQNCTHWQDMTYEDIANMHLGAENGTSSSCS